MIENLTLQRQDAETIIETNKPPNQRLKVLVSAYAAAPHSGSEYGIGWHWVEQIAQLHDVWAITGAHNREKIENYLQENPLPHVKWIYFDILNWTKHWGERKHFERFYYYGWQIGIYLLAKKLHQQIGFDVVHHATLGTYWQPSFLVNLPVPMVWGPVGGGESAPKAYYQTFDLRGKIYEFLRDFIRWRSEWDPFVHLTARRASIALATTNETADRMRKLGAKSIVVSPNIGLSTEEQDKLSKLAAAKGDVFRLVSIGRMLHWKGYHLGLKAFAQLLQDFPSAEYWFIGDGSEKVKLEELSQALGISRNVHFWGELPRAEVLEKLADCDVLVHPSLHDSGGWVCIEAMAAGRPVICLDLGGPAMQVTQETGFKIAAISPEHSVNDMGEAMKKLAGDPELRKQMGEASKLQVRQHFSWELKGEELSNIFKQQVRAWA